MSRLLGVRRLATAVAHRSAVEEVHIPLTRWPLQHDGPSTSSSAYVPLPAPIFDSPSRPDLLHRCVVAHLAGLRQGTAKTKNRAEVRGSQKKIMRQKGTGKARVGDAHSPIRRGGGRAFPKVPKDWSLGLNRKVWELGVRTALSERWRRGELVVIPDAPEQDVISTRELVRSLGSLDLSLSPSSSSSASSSSQSKTLFLVSEMHSGFALSARNLPHVTVLPVDDIDVYPLLQGHRVVLDLPAVQHICDRFSSASLDMIHAEEEQDLYEAQQALASEGQDEDHEDQLLSGSRDGQTDPETDGGIKEQDVVIEGEEAGVQEQRHPEDPLADQHNGSNEEKGDAIRGEMDKLAKENKVQVDKDRPSAKDVL